jgi:hypothetical protein
VNAVEATSAVAEYVRAAGLDYPTESLEADRFDASWLVCPGDGGRCQWRSGIVRSVRDSWSVILGM